MLGELIIPCQCRGTHRHVHRHCLNSWRAANMHQSGFHTCGTCRFHYVLFPSPVDEALLQREQRRHRTRVVRNVVLLLLAVQLWLSAFAVVIALLDVRFGRSLAVALSPVPLPLTMYLFSVLFSLAGIGLCGEFAAFMGLNSGGRQRDGFAMHGAALDREECDCNCGLAGMGCDCNAMEEDCGLSCTVVAIAVLLIVATVGIVYGVFYSTQLLSALGRRRFNSAWYRAETERQRVKDWTGEEATLHSLPAQSPRRNVRQGRSQAPRREAVSV